MLDLRAEIRQSPVDVPTLKCSWALPKNHRPRRIAVNIAKLPELLGR
jgi:hypothetical protein